MSIANSLLLARAPKHTLIGGEQLSRSIEKRPKRRLSESLLACFHPCRRAQRLGGLISMGRDNPTDLA